MHEAKTECEKEAYPLFINAACYTLQTETNETTNAADIAENKTALVRLQRFSPPHWR